MPAIPGQMDKPDVEYIEGLSPAISIEQKSTSKNPRSTVGTVTEIYDYLRLLYARIGRQHCPTCKSEITPQTVEQIVIRLMGLPEGTSSIYLLPLQDRRRVNINRYLKTFPIPDTAGSGLMVKLLNSQGRSP